MRNDGEVSNERLAVRGWLLTVSPPLPSARCILQSVASAFVFLPGIRLFNQDNPSIVSSTVRESVSDIESPPGNSRADNVADAQRGDLGSFERLVRTHQSYAFSLAMKFLSDEAEADDVTQEAFVRVWKNISQYNPDQKFTTWLYKIVTNLCIDRFRSLQRTRRVILSGGHHSALQDIPDERNWETLQSHDQLAEIVGMVAGQLSEKQRIVFTLRDLQDLSVDEVVQITGLSVGSVKTNLHYARKFIRDILVRKYGVAGSDL